MALLTLNEFKLRNPHFDIEQGSEEWHGQRGVGSTAVSPLLCVSGGKKEWENTWKKYKGLDYQERDLSGILAIQYGKKMEPVAAQWVRDHGLPSDVQMLFPGLLEKKFFDTRYTDSPDFLLVSKSGDVMAVGEIKCAFSRQKTYTPNDIPLNYYLQCQWHMLISGTPYCLFVDYIKNAITMHVITADEHLQQTIIGCVHKRLSNEEYHEVPPTTRKNLRTLIRNSALNRMLHYILSFSHTITDDGKFLHLKGWDNPDLFI